MKQYVISEEQVNEACEAILVAQANLPDDDGTFGDPLRMLRSLPEAADPWKAAAHELATVGWMGDPWPDDPEAFLKKLIAGEVKIALDPAVSAEAQALIDRGTAQAAVQAQPPAGWKLVPVEPTPEMCHAAYNDRGGDFSSATQWKAMLDYAPLPPSSTDTAKVSAGDQPTDVKEPPMDAEGWYEDGSAS